MLQYNIKQCQRDVVVDMIHSANPCPEPREDDSWKLLVYDASGRDILAPLLKVKELRENGVTLHMMLGKQGTPVPGVPAIYFCAPTEENVSLIAKDCIAGMYDSIYINFYSQVPRPLLEVLAEQVLPLPNVDHIKVFDRTLSYCALSSDLFTLLHTRGFWSINSRHVTDSEMEDRLNSIVLGISHVLLSLQVLPIVAYLKGGAAEETARRVCVSVGDLLREHLLCPSAVAPRPLLLIVDRSHDLSAPLFQPFSYRGLLFDALKMHLNKVDVISGDGTPKSFEVDPERDAFYATNAPLDFSVIGEHVEAALSEYQKQYSELSADQPVEGEAPESGGSAVSRMLSQAPQLAETKRSLDTHTSLAYAVLSKIRERELDAYHGVAHALLTRSGFDFPQLKRLLQGKGSLADKQRLFLFAYLSAESDEELTQVEECLPLLGAEPFLALAYLKKLRSYANPQSPETSQPQAINAGWRFAQSLAKNLARTLKSTADATLPLTRLVDTLLQDPLSRAGSKKLTENVTACDPKTKQPVEVTNVRFSNAIVFVVGGGSIAEYDNLKVWEKANPRKGVTYGCTELLTGESYLEQLCVLGAE